MQAFKPSFFLILILFSYSLIQGSFYPLIVFAFSLLHEGGHLWAIHRLNGQAKPIRGHGHGMEIHFSHLSYRNEFFAALAGPLTNLILCLLFFGLAVALKSQFLWYCVFANLLLGTSNLLPIFPLDGGRMLACYLAEHTEPIKRLRIMQTISLCLLLPLIAIAFWLFLSSGYNGSLLLICIYLAVLTAAQSKGDFL